MWWFIVYKFTVNCIVYTKLLSQVTSLQYVTSLQQNVVTSYKFTLCYSLQQIATDQSVSYYTLHSFVAFVFFVQSEAFLPVQLQK